jgi:hypothetical protein
MRLGGTPKNKQHLILFLFDTIMDLPISEKEFKYILEKIKQDQQLYNKLWSFWFQYKYQNIK